MVTILDCVDNIIRTPQITFTVFELIFLPFIMGFAGWAAATVTFRTCAAVVGISCHLLSYGALATGNVPLAALLITVGETSIVMVGAPPGTNPLENMVTAPAAVISGPA